MDILAEQFGLTGRVAVVTGGSGILGRAIALGLAKAGARVAIIGRRIEACSAVADEIHAAGGIAIGIAADVLDRTAVEDASARIVTELGNIDILINGAGGNQPGATTNADLPWHAITDTAVDAVWHGNFLGAFHCSQIFGREMAKRGEGSIINISSMGAIRPLTHVAIYSAAKAALTNFTQWLAVTVAQEGCPGIRVNAIAPGFFLTEQNRYLLTDPATGAWTARGATILAHTPMGRMGTPDDLVGTVLWLASSGSRFVTGIVVPVDGGFSSFSGV